MDSYHNREALKENIRQAVRLKGDNNYNYIDAINGISIYVSTRDSSFITHKDMLHHNITSKLYMDESKISEYYDKDLTDFVNEEKHTFLTELIKEAVLSKDDDNYDYMSAINDIDKYIKTNDNTSFASLPGLSESITNESFFSKEQLTVLVRSERRKHFIGLLEQTYGRKHEYESRYEDGTGQTIMYSFYQPIESYLETKNADLVTRKNGLRGFIKSISSDDLRELLDPKVYKQDKKFISDLVDYKEPVEQAESSKLAVTPEQSENLEGKGLENKFTALKKQLKGAVSDAVASTVAEAETPEAVASTNASKFEDRATELRDEARTEAREAARTEAGEADSADNSYDSDGFKI